MATKSPGSNNAFRELQRRATEKARGIAGRKGKGNPKGRGGGVGGGEKK